MKPLHHRREFRIASSHVDVNGRATLQSMLHFLEEMGWEHAAILGLGFNALNHDHLAWVLLRMRVRVGRFPAWSETVYVKTWPAAKDRLYWYRDYTIHDSNDREVTRATSTFVIIDTKTRRPRRADDMFRVDLGNPERTFKEKPGKLPAVDDETARYQKTVTTSDLDINDHVNNVKYVEWVLDSYPLEFFKSHTIAEVEMNHLGEARYGDMVTVRRCERNAAHFHSVARASDLRELFRARIEWKRR